MAKCPNCGQKLTGKINFCVYCGTNLKTGEKSWAMEMESIAKSKAAETPAPVHPQPPVQTPEKKPAPASESFETNILTSEPAPAVMSETFETGLLEEELMSAAPVQTITEVKQELPKPNKSAEKQNYSHSNITKTNTSELIQKYGKNKSATSNTPQPSVVKPSYTDNSVSSQKPQPSVVKPSYTDNSVSSQKPQPSVVKPSYTDNSVSSQKPQPSVVKPSYTDNSVSSQKPQPSVVKPSYTDNSAQENKPALVRVVSCVGLDLKTAKLMLDRTGLKYEITRKNNDRIQKGEIISQSETAGSQVSPDTVIKLVVSCGTWSEWSENEPDSENNEIESKTEYRTRTRKKITDKKTSSVSDSMEGYTLCDSKKDYSDWNTEQYFTNIPRKTSEICEMTENLIGFKYCGWFYKGKSSIVRNSFCSLESALYFNNDTNENDWEYRETISYNNVRETIVAWSPASENAVAETPAGDKIRSNIHMITYRIDGTDYPLKYGSFETQWYKYRSRSMNGLTYYFEKEGFSDWSSWSEWSEKSEVPTELTDVESRVMYRSKEKEE